MKHETLLSLDPRTVRVVKSQITQALTTLERAIVAARTAERDKHRERSRLQQSEPRF